MPKEIKHQKCNTNCTAVVRIAEHDFCRLKLQDITKPKDSAKLSDGECLWFRVKK